MNNPLAGATGFDWDHGNLAKSRVKHGVSPEEAEEVFLGAPVVAEDARHSRQEPRWIAYGKTFEGRALAIAFTVRGKLVRVICARPMNEKERNDYA